MARGKDVRFCIVVLTLINKKAPFCVFSYELFVFLDYLSYLCHRKIWNRFPKVHIISSLERSEVIKVDSK